MLYASMRVRLSPSPWSLKYPLYASRFIRRASSCRPRAENVLARLLRKARTASSDPPIVKNCRVHPTQWLISTQVVVLARTGATAQLFSKYKLPMPVIVVTCFDYVARQCVALIPGCQAVHTPQYTNYGYNNAAGDDEAKMVAEGTKHAAEIGVITKADEIVCAVHAYKAGATKNVAMRFYYAGAAL